MKKTIVACIVASATAIHPPPLISGSGKRTAGLLWKLTTGVRRTRVGRRRRRARTSTVYRGRDKLGLPLALLRFKLQLRRKRRRTIVRTSLGLGCNLAIVMETAAAFQAFFA
ncbi:unnamed protein product [Amoebophrya sp. A120]|nr:unnamed protein product [Amoebophrya sp. A120]|eukprot:GSA120T00007440001.1